ncbi:conjugal transfer protein TraG N-terminal domain-containing protein [Methylotuvimicrobium sp. KM1]|uniref:conjugal transfer protein TraG N-terminal domain-containing protein n=1 Tax=Methylotuvimicrobium sp. KM1 TaxID=3377707 RepID=UPI00384D4593
MGVSSYLEIYLTQFGWTMYNVFWDILIDTGLAYLPFIGMFLRNIVEPITSQEAKDASSVSLRRIETDAVKMFAVLVIAIQPYMTVSYNNLSYTQACSPGGNAVVGGNTGKTYDTTFTAATLGGNNALVPIWWYAVLAVTGGINDAAILAIPCTHNIRLMSFSIDNARVKDPQLRRQVQLFYKDCYRHAMAMFLDHNPPYPNNLPQEDLNWLGSQFFLNGTYQTARASATVPGFTYDPNRDREYDPDVYIPVDGKPTCAQWWTGNGHINGIGLREALADQIDAGALATFKQYVANKTGKAQDEVENIAIQTLISREETAFNGLGNLNSYNEASFANAASSAGATLGSFMEAVSFYPALYAMKAAAPIIQAVVLMLIYALMPFYFWFSSYQPGKIIFMSIIVFSVKFWTVLWAIANWLDNNLIEAIKPSWYNLQLMTNNLLVEMIIDFVIGGLFVVMPLFWSGLLTWAGFRVGSEINKASGELRGSPEDAGKKGGNAAKSTITKR